MQSRFSLLDIFSLGFMAFSLFLGASNFIFPPEVGVKSGDSFLISMAGFLVSAVGLPLLTLLAVARSKGNILSNLPPFIALPFLFALYLIIGPLYAAPRSGLVVYDICITPFFEHSNSFKFIVIGLFFIISGFLSLRKDSLIDILGKVLTPVLVLLLLILSLSLFFFDPKAAAVVSASSIYEGSYFFNGLIEGYNTMDGLGAIIFSFLIIEVLKKKNITDVKLQTKYIILSGFISALLLSFVYVSLVYVGYFSSKISTLTQGSFILNNYVDYMFGSYGSIILSLAVFLACLTTAVGLISGCADFFNKQHKNISYKKFVIFVSFISFLTSTIGLKSLVAFSVPVLLTIYPGSISLVILTFCNQYLLNSNLAYRVLFGLAIFYGFIDAMHHLGFNLEVLSYLESVKLSWVVPVLFVLLMFINVSNKREIHHD